MNDLLRRNLRISDLETDEPQNQSLPRSNQGQSSQTDRSDVLGSQNEENVDGGDDPRETDGEEDDNGLRRRRR